MKGGLRIGSIAGVKVTVHPSWILVFLLAVVWLGSVGPSIGGLVGATRWIVAPVVALAFFASVLVHELAHAFVARRLGVNVQEVMLFIFGGAARLEQEAPTPGKEALITLAGPAVSALLGGALIALGTLAGGIPNDTATVFAVIAIWLGAINLFLAIFNLVPGFPMDGGRLLRAALWARQGDFRTATRSAARLGRYFSYVLLAIGAFLALTGEVVVGVWILVISWFLQRAADSSYRHAELAQLVEGVSVRDVMEREVAVVNPNLALDTFAQQYLASGERGLFPVSSAGELVGTIDLNQVRRVPRGSWPTTRVREVMSGLDAMFSLTEPQPVMDAVGRFQTTDAQAIPVVDPQDRGRLLGMVTRDGLVRALRRHEAVRGG